MAIIRIPDLQGQEVCLHKIFDLSSCSSCTIEMLTGLDPETGTNEDGFDSVLIVEKKLTPEEREAARVAFTKMKAKAQAYDSSGMVTQLDAELNKIPEPE